LKSSASLLVASVLIVFGHATVARDWFAAPVGNGTKDGTSQENAIGTEALQSALDQFKPGDNLLLAGGEYRDLKLTVRSSGTPEQPISIRATDPTARPVVVSNWTIASPQNGPIAFFIQPGVSNLDIQDLTIRGYQQGVSARAVTGAVPRTGLRFQNVYMEHVRHGFYLSDCSNLALTSCKVVRYSKHAFRLDAGCSNVTFLHCLADCSEGDPEWEKLTEALPFGFVVTDGGAPNTNIAFDSCTSRNNMMPLQKSTYKNGDGFVVEGNSESVAFKRCIATDNQDAGFDLKVKDVRLDDCIAFRNKRDFRIWTTGQLTNCYAGWSPVGIWTNGGPIIAERCTIAGWKSSSVDTEDASVGIELRKCLLVPDRAARPHPNQLKRARLDDCIEAKDLQSAGLQRPPDKWNGEIPILESATYPDKGFRSFER
jgi:hypothetical protein